MKFHGFHVRTYGRHIPLTLPPLKDISPTDIIISLIIVIFVIWFMLSPKRRQWILDGLGGKKNPPK